jgi:hypothetical protein
VESVLNCAVPFARTNWDTPLGALVAVLVLASSAGFLHAAGVTLVTHGENGTTTGWISGMATNALSPRLGGDVPVYRINVTSNATGLVTSVAKVAGGSPLTSTNGELIVMLDWGAVSSGNPTTFDVAGVVAPLFAQTNLIAELGGHALAEWPIHIMGHSRGGSLVCELSKLLGESGLWVDQVTALDAHPLNGDAPVAAYESVLFADSYFETNSFLHLADGQRMPGSHWRQQTVASGGYTGIYDWHSDVHLWYHGTIELATPASDTEAQIDASMRSNWWAAVEQQGTNAGFLYALAGGGNRLSTLQPNGATFSSPIRDGVNQRYDLGAGVTNNRTALPFNTGDWPNVIQLRLLTTNPVAQGTSAQLHIDFQWAVSVSQTQQVQVFLDSDRNPLNGNERLALAGTASGTTGSQIGSGTITVPLDATNAPAGNYTVFVKVTAGARSRYLYAGDVLTVVPSTAPPWLDIAADTGGGVVVGVNGVAGQTVIVQQADAFGTWQSVATNLLAAPRWVIPMPATSANTFYRAVVATPLAH